MFSGHLHKLFCSRAIIAQGSSYARKTNSSQLHELHSSWTEEPKFLCPKASCGVKHEAYHEFNIGDHECSKFLLKDPCSLHVICMHVNTSSLRATLKKNSNHRFEKISLITIFFLLFTKGQAYYAYDVITSLKCQIIQNNSKLPF